MLGIQIYYKVRCFMNGILFLNALNTYRKDASSRPLIIKFPHHKILGCTTNRDVLLLSTLCSIRTLSAKYQCSAVSVQSQHSLTVFSAYYQHNLNVLVVNQIKFSFYADSFIQNISNLKNVNIQKFHFNYPGK